MEQFLRIGVDLAKNYFQVHALVAEGGKVVKRKLSRAKMREFFSNIQQSVVGMEACGSAHYWARELAAMGHEVRLMPPAYTKAYVKRGKNDAVDAEAICEAMSRPGMRFLPVKSAEQQATLMLHKTRELLMKQRTMTINALRGHLAEFGIVVAKASAASTNCSISLTQTRDCRLSPDRLSMSWRILSMESTRLSTKSSTGSGRLTIAVTSAN
ncbi:hypothetical+protein [Methylocapsa aurea]